MFRSISIALMTLGLCFSVACKRRAPISETPPETPAAPQAGQAPAGAEEAPAAAPPTAQAPQLPANDKSRYLFVDAGTINGDVNGPRAEAIPGVDHPLDEGDSIRLDALDLQFDVIAVPGHTRGHIAYFARQLGPDARPALFCGGMTLGTVLTLFVVPTVYTLLSTP